MAEALRMDTFAINRSGDPSNARLAMNRDIVKPMPPRQAAP